MKLSPNNYVFAAADEVYIKHHAKAFINSANKFGYKPWIHIINPTNNKAIRDIVKDAARISSSFTSTGSKTEFACSRFLAAESYIDYWKSQDKPLNLLILDIDCYFNKFQKFPEEPLGLFLRKPFGAKGWVHEGSKIAAGMVYVTTESLDFLNHTCEYLMQYGMNRWYVDQVCLYKAYEKVKNNYPIYKFTNKDMDWEFSPDSWVWTGKGNRKKSNRNYLVGKAKNE